MLQYICTRSAPCREREVPGGALGLSLKLSKPLARSHETVYERLLDTEEDGRKSMGCRRKTMETLRVGFAEPIAGYAAWALIPNSTKTSVAALLERAGNEALRFQTGYVTSTPLDQLRDLVNLPSIDDISAAQAAKLCISIRIDTEILLEEALRTMTTFGVRENRSALNPTAEQ